MIDNDKKCLLFREHISTPLNMTKLYIHYSKANARNQFTILLQKALTAKY